MTIKSWLSEGMNVIWLVLIVCMIIAIICVVTHFWITLPNQACNECSYGQAIDANHPYGLRDYVQVQCENEAIIQYSLHRDIRDKWGNPSTEFGFWVTCGGNKQ